MNPKIRWGVLGAANIAVKLVIPAMQQGERSVVTAIASRDIDKARTAAESLGIPKAYGSYEELLADPDVDAVYNPLPNHLHLAWTVKAAQAGKHVLCEKPLAMNTAEALELIGVRDRTGVKIQEAFMIRVHPQWSRIPELIRSGRIGTVRSVMGYFHYNNTNSGDVRNILEYGGGGLLDIGCYLIYSSRLIYGEEPERAGGLLRRDPVFNTDMLTSAILEYPSGHAVFTCSTQAVPNQRIHVFGTEGRMEIEIPFTPPADQRPRIYIDDGSKLPNRYPEIIKFKKVNQYTLQGDVFSKAIQEDGELPLSLEGSLMNMAIIDSIFRSAETGAWERPAAIIDEAKNASSKSRPSRPSAGRRSK
jgi:predicted dehydrogenase